jgi:hypothetical protein
MANHERLEARAGTNGRQERIVGREERVVHETTTDGDPRPFDRGIGLVRSRRVTRHAAATGVIVTFGNSITDGTARARATA